MQRFVSSLLILLVFLWVCGGDTGASAASLQRAQIERSRDAERISLYSDVPVQPLKVFTLTAPDRLVIDLPALQIPASFGRPKEYSGTLIRAIRHGRFSPQVVRVVIDLDRPVALINNAVVAGDIPSQRRLVFDIKPTGAAPSASLAAPSVPPASVAATASAPLPTSKPKVQAVEAQKPIIVIDPGHGGKDPGALEGGLREKGITLDYAFALRKALLRTGRYRVALTREDDRFILLHDRVGIARKAAGDLFISLHADSNPNPRAEGFSVYTLSEEASDDETAALADQENKADIINGVDLSVQDKAVASILIDLAQRETRNASSQFAELVIAHMHRKVVSITNTHRYAGFRVLKAPDIPSVLIEIGFLSNANDRRRVQSSEYRMLVVDGLVKAVDAYFKQ